jgi:DNA-binding NarL/FixJ family response regulator/class 3 adenylate cyclase
MASLPSGVVTFLCSDIEGSTRLVQQLGDAYAGVLADTRRVLRDAMNTAGGLEIDATGDELFAAFERPEGAIEAAVAGQLGLVAHTWPDGVEVRVRMGVHTGVPMLGDDGYVGLDVHRAHRICSAGHGGQILLSEATSSLVADARVLELGVHRLRDLTEPERLFQLVHDELPGAFPQLRFASGVEDAMRVVLADDSVLLREGVARLLGEAGFDVVAQSGTREDVLRHVAMHKPNVAIVDIRMPPSHTDEGVRAAKEIRERFPEVGVLVLSQYVEPTYALELLSESAEGIGYLLKDRVSDIDEFAAAVRRVGEGGSALDPAVVSQLVGRRRRDDPLEALTPREREVLELMAEGRSNQAISERMFITPRAVEKHVTSIFHKLRLPATSEDHRRVLAVLTFLRA